MVRANSERPISREEGLALLEDTARSVKIMKASWLRVAMNLQKIRDGELWKLHPSGLKSFEDYVYGVLEINRGVARRMLDAMGYTRDRRPEILDAVLEGREDVHVPSYDVVNQLRRAEGAFAGRDDEFREIENRVWEEGVGRGTLRREIQDRLDPDEEEDEGGPSGSSDTAAPWDEEVTLGGVIEDLGRIERKLLRLEVSKEARQLLFRLVETLQKEHRGSRPAFSS